MAFFVIIKVTQTEVLTMSKKIERLRVKINKDRWFDKVYGCWVGKNIGGTIGGPFEGSKEPVEIDGFTTPKGAALPNDDLDLQLVWLKAVQEKGPLGINANVLADYWQTYICPHWGEYGVAHGNLTVGLLPPLSGSFDNEDWGKSNGAWIRSEIWACLAPAIPNIAVKYAIMDAMVDHGFSEGTYAEMYVVAMESMSFFEENLRTLVERALEYIPADSRVAKSVKTVLEEYDKGTSIKELRKILIDQSADIGMFQSPANVGFVVAGLIYGEGDFKKSILTAMYFGDDTDCTAATVGAIFGIIYGESQIPADWKEYIGDGIMTKCINAAYIYSNNFPLTCTELTEVITDLTDGVLKAHGAALDLVDGESSIDHEKASEILKGYAQSVLSRSPYSFEIDTTPHTSAVVEYDEAPIVKAGVPFKIRITLYNKRRDAHHMQTKLILPEGWTADYPRDIMLHQYTLNGEARTWNITVYPNENIVAENKIYAVFESKFNVLPLIVPIVLLG